MAKEIALKYGCNPNQKPSRIYMENGELPVTVLNGRPERPKSIRKNTDTHNLSIDSSG